LSFQWIYLVFLALQFVLALGNRPKGEKMLYVLTMWYVHSESFRNGCLEACSVYAFLSAYLVVCSVLLSIKAFQSLKFDGNGFFTVLKALITGPANVLLAALIATFGIYLIASILYVSLLPPDAFLSLMIGLQRDPWHMFTSFAPYMLLAPSFTNVLNVYAFCNLHDVSWGTKGSDKADTLPSVNTKEKKDGAQVVEDVTKTPEELENAFQETVTRAITKVEKKDEVEKPTLDDSNKTFRTRLVAAWMLTNGALAVGIENASSFVDRTNVDQVIKQQNDLRSKQEIYFSVILWSTFGLSMVRFLGVSFFVSTTPISWLT
jgi:chitin synthase